LRSAGVGGTWKRTDVAEARAQAITRLRSAVVSDRLFEDARVVESVRAILKLRGIEALSLAADRVARELIVVEAECTRAARDRTHEREEEPGIKALGRPGHSAPPSDTPIDCGLTQGEADALRRAADFGREEGPVMRRTVPIAPTPRAPIPTH